MPRWQRGPGPKYQLAACRFARSRRRARCSCAASPCPGRPPEAARPPRRLAQSLADGDAGGARRGRAAGGRRRLLRSPAERRAGAAGRRRALQPEPGGDRRARAGPRGAGAERPAARPARPPGGARRRGARASEHHARRAAGVDRGAGRARRAARPPPARGCGRSESAWRAVAAASASAPARARGARATARSPLRGRARQLHRLDARRRGRRKSGERVRRTLSAGIARVADRGRAGADPRRQRRSRRAVAATGLAGPRCPAVATGRASPHPGLRGDPARPLSPSARSRCSRRPSTPLRRGAHP